MGEGVRGRRREDEREEEEGVWESGGREEGDVEGTTRVR